MNASDVQPIVQDHTRPVSKLKHKCTPMWPCRFGIPGGIPSGILIPVRCRSPDPAPNPSRKSQAILSTTRRCVYPTESWVSDPLQKNSNKNAHQCDHAIWGYQCTFVVCVSVCDRRNTYHVCRKPSKTGWNWVTQRTRVKPHRGDILL